MKFTEEDFANIGTTLLTSDSLSIEEEAARVANEKLKEWMNTSKTLYSLEKNNTLWCKADKPYPYKFCGTLVDIREIEYCE